MGEKESRIKDANGNIIEPSDQPVCYASAMLRLRRENGGDGWVKRFFHELAACPSFNPDTREGSIEPVLVLAVVRQRGGAKGS